MIMSPKVLTDQSMLFKNIRLKSTMVLIISKHSNGSRDRGERLTTSADGHKHNRIGIL